MRYSHATVSLPLAIVIATAMVAMGCSSGTAESTTTVVEAPATATSTAETTVPATTATTNPTTTTTLASTIEGLVGFEWMEGDPGDGIIVSVAEAGDGFVGVRDQVAEDGGIPSATEIVVSGDGSGWEPVPDSPVRGEESVVWLTGNKWGVVGAVFDPLMSMDDPPDFILSSDGGTWVRMSPTAIEDEPSGEGLVIGIVWGEPGLVAIYAANIDTPTPTTSLHFSETGLTWVKVEQLPEGAPAGRVLASGAGFAAIGELGTPGSPGLGGWFSPDGRSWEQTTITDAIISGSGGSTGWREGFVVIRDVFAPTSDTYGSTIWESSNGLAWSESGTDLFDDVSSSGFEDSLQGSDLGLVTLGETAHDHDSEEVPDIEQFLMFSFNGNDWIKWNTKDLFGNATVIEYAIGSESLVVTLIDEQASDFESGEIVTHLWVGHPYSTTG